MFEIRIETDFVPLTLLEDLPQGVSKKSNVIERRSFGDSGLASVVFYFASSVSASVLGAWIFEKIKKQPKSIVKINNKETTIDKSGIIKIIEKEVEVQTE